MQSLKIQHCLIGLLVLSIVACTEKNPEPNSGFSWLTNTPIELKAQWKIANNQQQDAPWLAYYQGNSSLYLRSPQGDVKVLVDGASGAAPSGLALALNKDGTPATMWRDKIPSKGLFLKQGEKMPLELGVEGFDTEPLVRFDIKYDNKDVEEGLHALWYGERKDPQTGNKYNIYYRHIDKNGAPSSTELVLPGYYPQWIISTDNDVAVFSWDSSQTPPKILMRMRTTGTEKFDDKQVIASTSNSITPIFRTFSSGKRWFVLWVDQQGKNHDEFLVRGLWSQDKGKNWAAFDFPTIKGFDIADIKLAHDPISGNAVMAISGTWNIKDPAAMNTFYVAHSTDNGAHWGEPKVIRDADANATSKAEAAQVILGDKPGSLWIVWEDWRDVRGRLYFSYSEDYGVTWLHSNLQLAGQPDGNNIIAYNNENVYRNEQGIYIIASNVSNDAGTEKRILSINLNQEALQKSIDISSHHKKPQEKALKARVAEYWKAMSDENFDLSFKYFDPFTRAAFPVDIYKQRLGRIKYKENIVIDQIKINGNFADVSLRVTAFVPEFELAGKKQKMPEREVPINERWVFVDNNWFREYSEESTHVKFTRYQ